MSTFAVFGMTRAVAVAEAKKTVKTAGMNMSEWMEAVEKRASEIMGGTKTKQLSPMFDSPQFADDFIALARRTLKCRDMHIKARVTLTDEKGKPLIDAKTKAPKVGWRNYNPATEQLTA